MRAPRSARALVCIALVCLLSSAGARSEEQGIMNRCRAEADKLCPESKPGTPERRACVLENESKLPEECRAAIRRGGPARFEAMMNACGPDIETHCADVRRGGGRIVRCLEKAGPDKISAACKAQVDELSRGRGKQPPIPPEND